jgi:hypothetical protein
MHGILDYLVSAFLIASPWIFGFANGDIEMWLPIIIGVATIIMSLFTDYELGVVKMLGWRMHLMMDTLTGLLLAVSPWLFGFSDEVWAPHLIIGLLEIGVVLMSSTQPSSPAARNRSANIERPVMR